MVRVLQGSTCPQKCTWITWGPCQHADSDSAGPRGGLRLCFSTQVPRDAHAAGPRTMVKASWPLTALPAPQSYVLWFCDPMAGGCSWWLGQEKAETGGHRFLLSLLAEAIWELLESGHFAKLGPKRFPLRLRLVCLVHIGERRMQSEVFPQSRRTEESNWLAGPGNF